MAADPDDKPILTHLEEQLQQLDPAERRAFIENNIQSAKERASEYVNRRSVLKAAGTGVGLGASLGVGYNEGVSHAKADASTSDGDGDVGTPSNPVDVFADGVDANSVGADELSVTNERHDIREYGAVGDGTTDNATALADALSAADTNGGTVVIPGGDFYYGSTIDVTGISEVAVVGVGEASILRHDDVSDDGITGSGLSNVRFKNFRHIGNTTAGRKQQGIQLTSSTDIVFKGLTVEDWDGDGLVWFDGCDNVRAIQNDVRNCGDNGINPGGSGSDTTESKVIANHVASCDSTGIHISSGADGVIVKGNSVTSCGIDFYECRNVELGGNTVEDAPNNAIFSSVGTADTLYGITIAENTVISPGTYGISIDDGADWRVKGNTVLGGDRGINIGANAVGDTNVVGNSVVASGTRTELSGGANYGIVVSTGNASVNDNNIKGTFGTADIQSGAAYLTIVGNRCDGNINSTGDNNTVAGNIAKGGVTASGTGSVTSANITS